MGIGGNDSNNGSSWALRKLTLSSIQAIPPAAGDTVYIGPGIYQINNQSLSVAGSGGSPITYIGDVSGANTDQIGGAVVLTGSADQKSASNASVITTSANYITLSQFIFEQCTSALLNLSNVTNNIVQDCIFQYSANDGIQITGSSQSTNTVQRCLFQFLNNNCIWYQNGSTVNNTANVAQNCVFLSGIATGVNVTRVGGITINNCFISTNTGVNIATVPAAGQTITVNDCVLTAMNAALKGLTSTAFLVEDYNAFYGNATDRTTVSTGTHSNTWPYLSDAVRMISTFWAHEVANPLQFFTPSSRSQLNQITGTSTASDDMFGMSRPATAAKLSWGPLQYNDVSRSTTQAQAGSLSLKLADAGRTQFVIPTSNVSTTFSCYVYREASYAGTNPQMVIRQPGQAATTVTDAGSASTWNQLTTTLTPAQYPDYVIIELVSSNTATSSSFAVYFDTVSIS